MKITIDTEKKLLIIHEDTPLMELLSYIETVFPDNEWTEYKLKHEPLTVKEYVYVPFYQPNPNYATWCGTPTQEIPVYNPVTFGNIKT